jgi:hypothetical protein
MFHDLRAWVTSLLLTLPNDPEHLTTARPYVVLVLYVASHSLVNVRPASKFTWQNCNRVGIIWRWVAVRTRSTLFESVTPSLQNLLQQYTSLQ